MNEMDKNERSALLKKLKEKGISPLENSSDKSDYKEVIKNVLEHMNNVGGYSSDQVREDIEAIIDLKSANDKYHEVHLLQSNNRMILLVPVLFVIFLSIFGLVLINNTENEFVYGLGFLTFLIGGLGIAVRQDYKKTEDTLDRLILEVWEGNKKAAEVKARLGIKEVYKPEEFIMMQEPRVLKNLWCILAAADFLGRPF